MDKKQEALRAIPQVDALLESAPVKALLQETSRELLAKAAREVLAQTREDILHDRPVSLSDSDLALAIQQKAQSYRLPGQQPVINASGVLLHTNLGRAPLSRRAGEAAFMAACNYLTLEYDLKTGQRGNRHDHVEGLLCELLHAPAALVVNNNAAAVLLMLTALAKGQEVVVSRGELVEIGGAFRVPEVMQQGGCLLREVGTTNKTKRADYEQAIGPDTAALLKVHTSNYQIVGFTESVPVLDLSPIAKKAGLPLLYDLGSGALLPLGDYGLSPQPGPKEALQEGADVVCFSGDKLLGGPQAGLIVGQKDLVDRMRRHPLMRALRPDKMTLAALEATLQSYLDPAMALAEIPLFEMLNTDLVTLRTRAEGLKTALEALPLVELMVMETTAQLGGGSAPGEEMPSFGLGVRHHKQSADQLARGLRNQQRPVIARVQKDWVVLDLRCVRREELPLLQDMVKAALTGKDTPHA